MNARESFAYVVRVEGSVTILNLHDTNRGQVATHPDGLASVTEVGSMIGIGSGSRLFVARVRSLSFAEPREAHTSGIASTAPGRDPLRHLEAVVVGYIERFGEEVRFVGGGVFSPALGAEAYPLSTKEIAAVLGTSTVREPSIELGRDARGGGSVRCGLDQVLPRHVAVLGSTGQGKSCFTAAVLQQLARMPGARIVIFDVNGEYERALHPAHVESAAFKRTALGAGGMKIPYFALGRAGLFRLLLPSEKTQRPALAFALDNLKFVKTNTTNNGTALAEGQRCIFFDDCRPDGAKDAWDGIQQLRNGNAKDATKWPHMVALAALVAESHAVTRTKHGFERNAFAYGAVSPLVSRIHRYIDDSRFRSVVDVEARPPSGGGALDWEAEGHHLCHEIFGSGGPVDWRVHIVDLRAVSHDLMPFVLGSLLELLAQDLFSRGPESTYPLSWFWRRRTITSGQRVTRAMKAPAGAASLTSAWRKRGGSFS